MKNKEIELGTIKGYEYILKQYGEDDFSVIRIGDYDDYYGACLADTMHAGTEQSCMDWFTKAFQQ